MLNKAGSKHTENNNDPIVIGFDKIRNVARPSTEDSMAKICISNTWMSNQMVRRFDGTDRRQVRQ